MDRARLWVRALRRRRTLARAAVVGARRLARLRQEWLKVGATAVQVTPPSVVCQRSGGVVGNGVWPPVSSPPPIVSFKETAQPVCGLMKSSHEISAGPLPLMAPPGACAHEAPASDVVHNTGIGLLFPVAPIAT